VDIVISLRTRTEILITILPPSSQSSSAGTDTASGKSLVIMLSFPVTMQALPPPQAGGDQIIGNADNASIAEARFTIDPKHVFQHGMQNGLQDGVYMQYTDPTNDDLKLSALYCGGCNAMLLKEGSLKRILPLPSPFWHELSEMWICHEDFKCRSEIANMSPADLRPRPGKKPSDFSPI
jgi:hypothetical protein